MNNKDLKHFRTLIMHNYLTLTHKNRRYNGLHNLNSTLLDAGKGNRNARPEEILYFINRTEEYIDQMLAALERIAKNKYGMCVSCGKEILRERLDEIPHTRHCISCKNKKEE